MDSSNRPPAPGSTNSRAIQPSLSIAEIHAELGGTGAIPRARVAPEQWNAERLNRFLEEIDSRIASGTYDGAVTIAYTCLEAFLKARMPNEATDGISQGADAKRSD